MFLFAISVSVAQNSAPNLEAALQKKYSLLAAYCDKYLRTDVLPGGTSSYSGERCASADGRFRTYFKDNRDMSPPVSIWSDGQTYSSYDSSRGLRTREGVEIKAIFAELYVNHEWYVPSLSLDQIQSGITLFTPVASGENSELLFYERTINSPRPVLRYQRIGISKSDGLIRRVENTFENGDKMYPQGHKYIFEISEIRVNDAVHSSDYKVFIAPWNRIFNANDWRFTSAGLSVIAFLFFGAVMSARMVALNAERTVPNYRRMKRWFVALIILIVIIGAAFFLLSQSRTVSYHVAPYYLLFAAYFLAPLGAAVTGALLALIAIPIATRKLLVFLKKN